MPIKNAPLPQHGSIIFQVAIYSIPYIYSNLSNISSTTQSGVNISAFFLRSN